MEAEIFHLENIRSLKNPNQEGEREMFKKSFERNVVLYYAYTAFNEPLFKGTILVFVIQSLGMMPLFEIYRMEAIILGLCILLDIPSGALADMIGRKRTIVLGRIFLLASMIGFALMTCPLDVWIANIFWAIGYVLQSGADTALLYDSLAQEKKESKYQKVIGQAIGAKMILTAFGSLATGILADIDLRLPLYVSIFPVALPLFVSILFLEAKKTEKYSATKQWEILKKGSVFAWQSLPIRWMILFSALVAVVSKIWFFSYNPYFELVGINITQWGFIFFLLNIVAWLSSHFAYRIENTLGEKKCLMAIIFCLAIPLILMGVCPTKPFAYLVLMQNLVRGFINPFITNFLHNHATNDIRATIMSTQTTIVNLVGMIGLGIFGSIIGSGGLLISLILLGALTLILGGISYYIYITKINRS